MRLPRRYAPRNDDSLRDTWEALMARPLAGLDTDGRIPEASLRLVLGPVIMGRIRALWQVRRQMQVTPTIGVPLLVMYEAARRGLVGRN